MPLDAHDADQVITDSGAKVKDFVDEFRKQWAAPYTALAQKQQQKEVRNTLRTVYEQRTTPEIRAQLVNELGEAKVKAFEKLLEVNSGK